MNLRNLSFQLFIGLCLTFNKKAAVMATAAVYKSLPTNGTVRTPDSVYEKVPTLQFCSFLCLEWTTHEKTICFSYTYNFVTHKCSLSNGLVDSITTDFDAELNHDEEITFYLQELQFDATTYSVTQQGECVRQYLQPVTDVSLGQCFQLHESSSTPDEQFSYDPTLRQCYLIVPKLPVDFSCSSDEASVLTLQSLVEDGDPVYGAPHKLNMSGPFISSPTYEGRPLERAFDGLKGYVNTFISERDFSNPWIGGDIGSDKIIAGAKFWTRIGCCAEKIQNVHFLVALDASMLDSDYNRSLCSVYQGPPEMSPMNLADVEWFPCPLKLGRHFKMISFTDSGLLDVAEVEIFGY